MKTVLITGASKGIGKATAEEFDRLGYNVVVNYNSSESEAKSLCSKLKSAVAIKADISDPPAVQSMVDEAVDRFKTIDVLVNNAGIASQKLITDVSDEEFDRMYAVDLKGVFLCCKAVLPYMIRKQAGSIVNISSIWGITGASCEVAYSAMKAGVIGFTKALAKEVGPSHINVNCVAPGVITTDMNNNLSSETLEALKEESPLERLGTPLDVAKAVCFLAGEDASFITGQVLSPNGGFVI